MKMKKLTAVLCAMMLLSCPMASISAQELESADEGVSSEVTASEDTQEPTEEVLSEALPESEDTTVLEDVSELEDTVVSENASEPEDSVIPEEEETPEETTQPEETVEILIVTEFTVDGNGDVVSESITPYSVDLLRSVTNSLSISGGIATCVGNATCNGTVYSLNMSNTLERINNGTWYTYQKWSGGKSNCSSYSMTNTTSVISGTYRLLTYVTVTGSGGTDSGLAVSPNRW